MDAKSLMNKKVLLVIAFNDYQDDELSVAREVLEKYGAETLVVSTEMGEAQGLLGGKIEVDMSLRELEVAACDALVLIGGQGSSVLFEDPTLIQILNEAQEKGKIIGAICIASMILANAGLLQGKKATGFSSLEGKLKEKGAEYVPEPVVADGKIVTANLSEDSAALAEKLAEMLVS